MDVHGAVCVAEGGEGLGEAVVGGGDGGDHGGLGGAAEGVAEEPGEGGVPVGDETRRGVLAPTAESQDDAAEGGETLVDEGGLLEVSDFVPYRRMDGRASQWSKPEQAGRGRSKRNFLRSFYIAQPSPCLSCADSRKYGRPPKEMAFCRGTLLCCRVVCAVGRSLPARSTRLS